ncbi:MAG: hypothetical protein J7L54_01105 [Elusimicrobia bacterium]|nr:hypothetical protein [Elusimicrobiota bacterium]
MADKEGKPACRIFGAGGEYEHHINQLVYKLYGLTEEEIKIVGSGS